jgi:DNA invertase Pin-like site-specific DNA recombinase
MRYVSYFRVSTDRQGIHGLGMDAQEHAVKLFLKGEVPLAEFREVETGKLNTRPELQKAIAICKKEKATLLIAKLDRLARNAAFVLGLRDCGVEFIACDYPQANRLTIGILAVIAEHEREMISKRTKEGLAAAKRRGIRLGNPNPGRALELAQQRRQEKAQNFSEKLLPIIADIRSSNATSLRQIARCLNLRGIRTVTGKEFHPQTVKDVLEFKPGEQQQARVPVRQA